MKITIQKIIFGIALLSGLGLKALAQDKEVKLFLNDEKTHWVKGTGLGQIWVRYTDLNPGSTIFGTPKSNSFDVSLRRVRYQVMGQVTDKVFVYTQFGINSFGPLSGRKPGLFLHDVTAEYAVSGRKLHLGAGLHGWNGTVRYSSSSVGSILGLDLPFIEESTNDISDQFVRRLGVYANGQLGRFDYRFSVSNPFPVQTALSPVASLPDNQVNVAYYSKSAPELIYQGYAYWQFKDKETNQIPYMTGTYLGKKSVFNVGLGFSSQKNAMEYRAQSNGPVLATAAKQLGVDVFYDAPISKEKGTALTAYTSYIKYDFGPNYLRNGGAVNTANGVNALGSFNGPGNNFPLIGTGTVSYSQVGYLMRNDLLGKSGTLQPYFQLIVSDYDRVANPFTVYDIGVNWLQAGHRSKLSLDYQSRPILVEGSQEKLVKDNQSPRKGMLVMQYQFSF
ncbi:hypothetical protein [Algoriphagus sanaruensis]|uniref:Porin n=1 Tax=Algoriphagus sanaruensis TaxID=1727163 RepID=A0A142EQ74_9BACT|nr:hypothetical protein [Algoriphagus sanaruensis]AMQ57279.1 hypothetical protein AO498_12600 [Algoriphagus sanaruensis]